MSPIRNIWDETQVDLKKDGITPLDILQEQAKAINKQTDKTNIVSYVMSFSTTTNGLVDEIKHVLYLIPKNGNDYNYRFIEIASKPDTDYPLTVFAYQSGESNFGPCQDEKDFYSALSKIFKDKRLKIVFEQLKNIGNTIENWNNNKE